ncbi:MAG TPA: pyridoxamine 5'-phosphate oxidase family protein, partial [Steroidobacteraceae bacterium]
MKKEKQTDPQMQKLADLIGEASVAMLTTEDADGSLRSRPLATLLMDSAGKLWFFTAMSSGKVGEIDQHRKVNLSYANLDKQDYVSISGHARLFRDPEKAKELWTPWVEPWFPDG